MHQEDKPRNKIGIERTVGEITLGPQYSLQGGYFFEILQTSKRLRRSYWTPANMTKDVIERYDTFNTKVFPEDLIFGHFNDQPIPPTSSNLTNDCDNDGTNIDDSLENNKGVEDEVVANDEKNDDNSPASDIDPPTTIFW